MTPPQDSATTDQTDSKAQQRRVSFLDQALWKALADSASIPVFARGWLGLQCRFLPGAQGGVIVLAETPGEGPFAPAAIWPEDKIVSSSVSAVVELAISEKRPVLKEIAASGGARVATVAHPIIVDGKLCGAAAVRYDMKAAPSGQEVLAQLRWGAGWLEAMLRREDAAGRAREMHRVVTGFELLAGSLEQERFKPACTALATDLALRLDCEQVAVGFRGRSRSTSVVALSHSAQFGRRMDLMRRIGFAMDEALDQESAVIFPAGDDWEYRISNAHAELSSILMNGCLLTIPLHRNGQMLGAITLQRRAVAEFKDDEIQLVDTVAGLLGPVLEEKRLNDRLVIFKLADAIGRQTRRLLGPGYFGRKLATLVVAGLVTFFSFATTEFRVATPAVIEGQVQRALVAPFDGFVASQNAKAGDLVKQGQVLAKLDDRDLILERLQIAAELRQHQAEYDRALNEDERVDAQIMRAKIEESEAQIALLDARLERTEVSAPFDGIVIEGDLSQSVGSGLRRGDQLFVVAPLNEYRLILEVDEGDIRELKAGMTGKFVPAAIPDLQLGYSIERVTPVSTAEEGRNFFRAEALLLDKDNRLRPGMEGVGKTGVDERLLIAVWSRELVDWVRLAVWRWLP